MHLLVCLKHTVSVFPGPSLCTCQKTSRRMLPMMTSLRSGCCAALKEHVFYRVPKFQLGNKAPQKKKNLDTEIGPGCILEASTSSRCQKTAWHISMKSWALSARQLGFQPSDAHGAHVQSAASCHGLQQKCCCIYVCDHRCQANMSDGVSLAFAKNGGPYQSCKTQFILRTHNARVSNMLWICVPEVEASQAFGRMGTGA